MVVLGGAALSAVVVRAVVVRAWCCAWCAVVVRAQRCVRGGCVGGSGVRVPYCQWPIANPKWGSVWLQVHKGSHTPVTNKKFLENFPRTQI